MKLTYQEWIQTAIAVGTLGAVFVAIWGEKIRAKLFTPALRIDQPKHLGELVPKSVIQAPTGGTREEKRRDYFLRISNATRFPTATNVRVYVTRLDRRIANQDMITFWSGEYPLKWRYPEVNPSTRSIGPAADVHLCSVIRDKCVDIATVMLTNENVDVFRHRKETTPFHLRVAVQAKSNNAESPVAEFDISWDGEWEDGNEEMRPHMTVKPTER